MIGWSSPLTFRGLDITRCLWRTVYKQLTFTELREDKVREGRGISSQYIGGWDVLMSVGTFFGGSRKGEKGDVDNIGSERWVFSPEH